MTARTLVLGVGNTLLQDDGAGVHAVNQLHERAGDLSGTDFLDAGTLSFTLATVIEDAEKLIIIDAAKMQQAPGTVQVFEGDEMDRFLNRQRRLSVHEVSIVDLLAIARLTGLLPARRALIGIEPLSLDWGDAPTAPVVQAIAHAGAAALDLIKKWQRPT